MSIAPYKRYRHRCDVAIALYKTVRVKQGMWKYWEALSESEQADYEVDDLSAVLELFEEEKRFDGES